MTELQQAQQRIEALEWSLAILENRIGFFMLDVNELLTEDHLLRHSKHYEVLSKRTEVKEIAKINDNLNNQNK